MQPSFLIASLLLGACSADGPASSSVGELQTVVGEGRPNILLIVADDLGYGDLGAYGGEIHTPNINSLAQSGARFTSFYTQVSCSPTRSIMLTGVDNHLNGMGTMAEDHLPHHSGEPGYVGYLNDTVVTLPRLLRDSGYFTVMSGKWHLGKTPGNYPADRGFEQSFALLGGGGNHFNGNGNNTFNPRNAYARNSERIERPEGIYSSDMYVDELLNFLESRSVKEAPFFAYLSFTAPHFPLQAPEQTIEKYSTRYTEGWDNIRAERFRRMKEIGLVAENIGLPERIEEVPAWDSLSPEEQAVEAKKMAIYAAMVDNLDYNVGRVIDHLKARGEYENTLILFMSDNGNDPYDRSGREAYVKFQGDDYDNSLDNLGAEDSYAFAGLGWAQVGSVHHRHYKFLPSEGGMHAPMIMHYPGIVEAGRDMNAFVSVLDITPTLLEIAGVAHPGSHYEGRSIVPMRGRSMLNYLTGEAAQLYADDEAVAFEIFGHGVVFRGSWKAVSLRPPWSDGSWKLYDLAKDPAEQNNLATEQAELLKEMLAAYVVFKQENQVIDEPVGATAYPYKPGHLGDLKPGLNTEKLD